MKIHRCEMEEIVFKGEPMLREDAKKYLKMLKEHLTIGRETLPKDESELVSGRAYRDPFWAKSFFLNAETVAEAVRWKFSKDTFRSFYGRSYRIVEEDGILGYILWVDGEGDLYVSTSVYTVMKRLKRKRYKKKEIPNPYAGENISHRLLLFGEKEFWEWLKVQLNFGKES